MIFSYDGFEEMMAGKEKRFAETLVTA